MANLILPNKFGFQPQYPAPLDQSNPLAKDFTVFVNFATPNYNAATGKALSIATVGTGVVQKATSKGLALYTPNDAWANIAVGEDWAGPNTIIAVCRINSIDNPWGGLFSKDTGSGTSTQFAVGRDNSTGSLYGSVADTTANSFGGASIPALVDFNVLVFTHSGVASTGMTYYRNGVLVGSTAGLDAQLSGAGVLGLGRSRDALTAYDSDVDWIAFGRAKRVFSDNEIASLPTGVSLWGLQKAPPRRLWAVSAGGVTLIGANSVEANTGGTGAISQIQILTGSPSAQSNASATGAISQGLTLTGLPSAQSNASSTGAITQTHVLVVANSAQSNAASAGAITSGINLAIASSVQGNASAAAAITQVHILVGVSSSQINAGSTGALSGANTLIGAMGTQSNASSAGMIFEVYIPPLPDGFVYLSVASTDF